MRGPTYRQLPNNNRHDFQYFGVSSIGHVAIIIDEYSIKKCRYNVGANHFKVVSFVDVCLNKLEDFFLDGTKSSDFWCLSRNISCVLLVSH